MPVFPRKKNDIVALAQQVVTGIGANATDYPDPPFDTTALAALLTAQATKVTMRQQVEAALSAAVDDENTGLDSIVEATKQLIQIAEGVHRTAPVKLAMIGWGEASEGTSNVCGQPRGLEAVNQGAGEIFLDWKAPTVTAGTGRPRFYRIERQVRNLANNTVTEEFGVWKEQATDSEITLSNQPRQVEIMYRVFAVNAAGDSVASNSVIVVL